MASFVPVFQPLLALKADAVAEMRQRHDSKGQKGWTKFVKCREKSNKV